MQGELYPLVCTNCSRQYPFDSSATRCDDCDEPLEVAQMQSGSICTSVFGKNPIARYADFYSYFDPKEIVSLGEGSTGLIEGGEAAALLGFSPDTLFLKNETQNPTWSFKDRGTATASNFARLSGYKRLGVCSSGNMAASVAAFAAAQNMQAFIFIPSAILEEKVLPIAVYGATVIKVRGDYGALYKESRNLGEKFGLCFINSDVPMRVEGSKSIAFEICEQFAFDPPEWVIVPTSSGGNLRGIEKGFREFKNAGLIDSVPRIVAAQAGGCAPLCRAYSCGAKTVEHFGNVQTVAPAIGNPLPPSGNQMLRMINAGRLNCAEMVAEGDILPAQRLMAKTGIFAQPASCVPFAAAGQMLQRGVIKKGERVVCIATGSGLKAASVLNETEGYRVFEEDRENLVDLLQSIE